jgi:hypothetical protein
LAPPDECKKTIASAIELTSSSPAMAADTPIFQMRGDRDRATRWTVTQPISYRVTDLLAMAGARCPGLSENG